MIPDFSGDFLSFESTEDGDIATILDEGKNEYSDTLKKEMFNIRVEVNGKSKTYSPSNKVGRVLQEAFGKDTKNWIGQRFQILHIDKKMAIRPIKVEKIK